VITYYPDLEAALSIYRLLVLVEIPSYLGSKKVRDSNRLDSFHASLHSRTSPTCIQYTVVSLLK
jgi:hypothetical protein